jgi:peptide/nickel transport system permease protein
VSAPPTLHLPSPAKRAALRVLTRVLTPLSLLLGLATLTFFLTYVAPGDPARIILGPNAREESVAQLREEMGLNRPAAQQFGAYLLRGATGRLGDSWVAKRPVLHEIVDHLRPTLTIGALASFLSIIVAVGLNAFFFLRPGSSRLLLPILRFGITVPGFVVAMAAALFSGRLLTWTSALGAPTGAQDAWTWLPPAFAAGIYPACLMTTLLRDRFAAIMVAPYFRAAQAAGHAPRELLGRVLLRNSWTMLVTIWVNQISLLAFSTIIVEHVFSFRGVGALLVRSIQGKDFPVLSGIVLLNGLFFILVQSLSGRLADPRTTRPQSASPLTQSQVTT